VSTGPTTGLLTTDAGGQVVLRRVLVRVVSGKSRGSEALLEQGTLVLGSHPDADLRVDDGTVSRHHAELALLSDGVRVRDLGSTNGTFVGESRIESVVVHPGAELRVGRTRIELLAADLPAPEVPPERMRFGPLVGRSAAMRRVFGLLESAAASNAPVLLEGESGVGKSTAAQAIHEASPRRNGPFVVHDAAAPKLDVALYNARGGTLVLDRVDELPGTVAAALVAALDRRERGEIDVRPIATSRVDLRTRVEAGVLRRDLYFHLAAIRVVLPPLREHREDLPLLTSELITRLGQPDLALSSEDLAPLHAHPFDGNVRELARLVEQSLATAAPTPAGPTIPEVGEELAQLPFKEAKEQLVDAFERRYVAALLERHGGNVSRAASEAGLDRNYLARLARKHGLR